MSKCGTHCVKFSNTNLEDAMMKLFNFGLIIRVLKVRSTDTIYSPPT